jgi:hypothetical protein
MAGGFLKLQHKTLDSGLRGLCRVPAVLEFSLR